ncbi:uncharacterized protein LOC105435648 [Cucumis sativus]|uniref:DUF3741 domain-containing protein n=1 Tax=Cucumis sativus TaxID=3659 RepID=A0A0A0KNC2_CUCSA|nr:uncharacterized protein LOC105435648 [Cucumis sativus]KGN50399.1 hypothetical protein Csa_000155 [Cucumis sativus]
MGKSEWWYFGGRSSSSRRVTTVDIDHFQRRDHSLPSCMSTLFHLFDFRSSHFTHIVFDNHRSSSFDLSHHHPTLRPTKASHHGVEAPRNSLELDNGDSISCLRNKEENLQLQMGLQIKTRNGSTKSKATEQQLPNNDNIIALESPSTNTPNLLARLMGLDNFPQTTFSSSYNHCMPNLGTRSLSESPRNSLSRLSDVDYHHRRLSLQINIQEKENNKIKICEEISKREKKKVERPKVALIDITNSYNKVRSKIQEIGSSQSRKVEMKSLKKLKKTTTNKSSSSKVVCRSNQKNVIVSNKQKSISMSMQIPKERRAREGEALDCPRSNKLDLLDHSTIFQPCSYPKGKAKAAGGETNAVDTATTTDGGSAEFKYIKTIQISSKENSNWVVVPASRFYHSVAGEERRWKKRVELQQAVVGGDQIPNNKGWWQKQRGRKRGWEFPHVKFELVEYALINKDLEKSKFIIMAEEREGIVKLVELHILDSLLRELTHSLIS